MRQNKARMVSLAALAVTALTLAAGSATAGIAVNNWTLDLINSEPFAQDWNFSGINSDGQPAAANSIFVGIRSDLSGTAGVFGNGASTTPFTSTAIATANVTQDDYTVTAHVNPLGQVASGRQGVIARFSSESGYVAAIDYTSGQFVLARYDQAGLPFSVGPTVPIPGFVNTNSYFVRILVRGDTVSISAFPSVSGTIGNEIGPVSAGGINPTNSTGDAGLFVRADSQATPAEMRLARVSYAGLTRKTSAIGIEEDIFFTNNLGELWVWGMNNATLIIPQQRLEIPSGFDLATTDDFNDDSLADLIIHNTATGQTQVRLSNPVNPTYLTFALPSVAPNEWEISGSGDFNMDGVPDLLYRNIASNELWIRTINRVRINSFTTVVSTGTHPFFPTPVGWELQAVADFTGDGFDDLFFRNDDGSNGIISVVAGRFTSWSPLPFAPTTWDVVGTGDYNNDGANDLLWQNVNGSLFQWSLNGFSVLSTSEVQSPTTPFRAVN